MHLAIKMKSSQGQTYTDNINIAPLVYQTHISINTNTRLVYQWCRDQRINIHIRVGRFARQREKIVALHNQRQSTSFGITILEDIEKLTKDQDFTEGEVAQCNKDTKLKNFFLFHKLVQLILFPSKPYLMFQHT